MWWLLDLQTKLNSITQDNGILEESGKLPSKCTFSVGGDKILVNSIFSVQTIMADETRTTALSISSEIIEFSFLLLNQAQQKPFICKQ